MSETVMTVDMALKRNLLPIIVYDRHGNVVPGKLTAFDVVTGYCWRFVEGDDGEPLVVDDELVTERFLADAPLHFKSEQ